MANIPKGWHRHENGGGLVQDTCAVAASVYVGPNAQVFGDAQVSGNARVFGDAWASSPLYSRHATLSYKLQMRLYSNWMSLQYA